MPWRFAAASSSICIVIQPRFAAASVRTDMITPGGSNVSAPTQSPTGAQRRFSNDMSRIAQQQMSANPAAAQTFKQTHKGSARPPVGTQNRPAQAQQPRLQSSGAQGAAPVQGQGPQNYASPQGGDPIVSRLIQEIQLDNFLNGGDVQDAFTKVKVRDYFNQRNSGPDTGRQVLEILGK